MFNKRKNSKDNELPGDAIAPVLAELKSVQATSPAPAPASSIFNSTPKPKPASTASVVRLESSDSPSVVSQGFEIKGELNSSGVLHVEGRISGRLTAHTVHISPTGVIDGELSCSSLNIKGTFTGTARCEDLVVSSTARVDGTVSYRFITIGSGAVVKGDLVSL
jgi:cytoskeletal protein CcmA (bactofilin family)